MDSTTAMDHYKMKVNVNATIEVPLETILAVRTGNDRTVGLGPVISTALRSAAIDAIQARPGSPGDTSSSPPISSADLREVDRAASAEATAAVDEVEEMMRKSLLEDERLLKTMPPDASKILAEGSDTHPAIAPDAKIDSQSDADSDRIEVPAEVAGATEAVRKVTATGKLVDVLVGYKNLQMTRQFPDTHTMTDIVAEIRTSLPKVPDHYRRLVWLADHIPEAQGIVLRGSTKLYNTDITKYGIVHLQSGECRTAGPQEGPALEERQIRVNVMVYDEDGDTTEVDDSWVDGHGITRPGPKMIAAQKARAKDPRLHSISTVISMRPTNTFWDVRKALQRLKMYGRGLYMSFEDRITGLQADDEMTLEEAGIDDGGKIYRKPVAPVSELIE